MLKIADNSRKGFHWAPPEGEEWRGVKPGEKSEVVYYWGQSLVPDKSENASPGDKKMVRFLKSFRVFNAEQAVKLPAQFLAPEDDAVRPEVETIAAAEKIITEFFARDKAPTRVENDPNRAFYVPSTDVLNMPPTDAFDSVAERYSTEFHEIGHSTGHPDRCNRKGFSSHAAFGSPVYGAEELVAELTSTFTCAYAGIDDSAAYDNSVSYLNSWINKINENPGVIHTSAQQAAKAFDWIIGRTYDDKEGASWNSRP